MTGMVLLLLRPALAHSSELHPKYTPENKKLTPALIPDTLAPVILNVNIGLLLANALLLGGAAVGC